VALDSQGILLMVTAVACTVLVADWGGSEYSRLDPVILGLAAAALAAWALFFCSQARCGAAHPLWLFRSRIFSLATLTGLSTVGVGMFWVITYIPTYLQIVHTLSATAAGAAAGLDDCRPHGRRHRLQPAGQQDRPLQAPAILGTSFMIIAALLLSSMDTGTSLITICGELFLLRTGVGLLMQNLVLAVQDAFLARDVGAATAAKNFLSRDRRHPRRRGGRRRLHPPSQRAARRAAHGQGGSVGWRHQLDHCCPRPFPTRHGAGRRDPGIQHAPTRCSAT
jgi:hypothetical protein